MLQEHVQEVQQVQLQVVVAAAALEAVHQATIAKATIMIVAGETTLLISATLLRVVIPITVADGALEETLIPVGITVADVSQLISGITTVTAAHHLAAVHVVHRLVVEVVAAQAAVQLQAIHAAETNPKSNFL